MKKLVIYPLVFLLSFLSTFALLLNVETVQRQLVENIASNFEEAFNAKIFFNNSDSFVCKNILFTGNQTFCIEKTQFSIDPFALLYGNLHFDKIAITGVEHQLSLEGELLFSLPYQFSGQFHLDDIPIEVKGDLSSGFRFTLMASKGKHTFFTETFLDPKSVGELTLFIYENDDPLLHLFAPFNWSKNQLESKIQGSFYTHTTENRFEGHFTSDFQQIQLLINLQSPLYYLENLFFNLEGTLALLNLEVKGDLEGSPFKITGPIQKESHQIKFNELAIVWNDFNGSIKALIDLNERIVQAKTSLFSDHFNHKVEGHLLLNCELCSSFDETFTFQIPQINLDLNTSMKARNWTFSGLKIHLNLDEIEGEFLGSLALKCDNARVDKNEFDQLNLNWKIAGSHLSPFNLQGHYDNEPIVLKGSASIVDERIKVFFDQLTAQFHGMPIALEKGGLFSFDGEKGSIDPIELSFGSSKCSFSYSWDEVRTSLMIDSPALNLTVLHQIFPRFPVKGFCHGRLQFEKSENQIKGSLLGKLMQFEILDIGYSPLFPLNGDINIRFNDKLADIRCDCIGPYQEEIILVGSIPLQFNQPVYSFFQEEGPIDIHIAIEGELSPFLKTVLSDTTLATGDTECQIEIKGSIKEPFVQGNITIKKGSYESLVLGCSFQDIDAKFSLNSRSLICESIVGRDSLGGTLTGKGRLDFTSKIPFDLELTADNAQILHLDYANATASGTIHFKGNQDAGLFEGALELDTLDIRLPDVTPTRLNALEVEYVNQPENEPSPTMFVQSDDPWPIFLEINLSFPDNAFVTASSFESEWRGKLNLKGSLDDPLLYGESKILDGHFLFNGKSFSSKEGTVHFNGSPGRKTSLYLIAKHYIDDLEIDVILKGPLREPELGFRSNPPKTSREILSWLLFNKGVGDIDSLQSEELSQNIIKLSDQMASGPNLLDRFRSSFGIDRIDITSTNSDDMSVRVGKYLTNRLFLSVKKSMNDQPNQASIEADLTHNFKAQAEVGDDAEARLMLKWERDY